jgi:putative flippase GtrA
MADYSSREDGQPPVAQRAQSAWARLWSLRAGAMLWRNTVASSAAFVIGLGVLWTLVEQAGVDEVVAAGIGFVVANTLHYGLSRTWIFRGTERGRATGYALFLINAAVGLVVTMVLYAAILEFTAIHYLVARVIVSLVAGLMVFVLNAVFNFRQI